MPKAKREDTEELDCTTCAAAPKGLAQSFLGHGVYYSLIGNGMPDPNPNLSQRDGDYSMFSAHKNNWPAQVYDGRLVDVFRAGLDGYSTFTKAGQDMQGLETYEGISRSTITRIIGATELLGYN